MPPRKYQSVFSLIDCREYSSDEITINVVAKLKYLRACVIAFQDNHLCVLISRDLDRSYLQIVDQLIADILYGDVSLTMKGVHMCNTIYSAVRNSTVHINTR